MIPKILRQNFLSFLILLQLIIQVLTQQEQHIVAAPTTYRYFIFSQQCYDTFMLDHNFTHIPCIKLTISKILSYGIVVGATIVKVPQIIKILKNKSTFGVSFQSVVLEEITQISAVAYNIFRGNPFSIYGQTLLITCQMLMIHFLFIILDKENRIKAGIIFPFIIAFFITGYYPELNLFPTYIFENMIIFQMVVFSGARLFQIFNIHKLKSTGSVSLITYGLSVLGNLARVVTSLVEVKDDYKLILSHVLAFGLNAYIVLCFFIFREKKEKKQ